MRRQENFQKSRPFDLDTKSIGSLPLVNHFLDRLRFDDFLHKHLPTPHPRNKLPPAQALGPLVRNFVIARAPLSGLGEWAEERVPSLVGLGLGQHAFLNDDRVGRALDHLFDADRCALLTDLVVHMIKVFRIRMKEFHNDSSTVTLHGEYNRATGLSPYTSR